jgi:hypothetical protein
MGYLPRPVTSAPRFLRNYWVVHFQEIWTVTNTFCPTKVRLIIKKLLFVSLMPVNPRANPAFIEYRYFAINTAAMDSKRGLSPICARSLIFPIALFCPYMARWANGVFSDLKSLSDSLVSHHKNESSYIGVINISLPVPDFMSVTHSPGSILPVNCGQ